jgi:RNA polymerase sigma-70 factor (ECF subfamily)
LPAAERLEGVGGAGQAERRAGDPRLHHVSLCHIRRLCWVTIYDTRRWGNVTMQQRTEDSTWLAEADSVGLALVVVLDTLAPAERLAFVLHDLFDVPFNEIAPMVGRSEAAARQLASRARRQVHLAGYRAPDTDRAAQRALVDAFFAAARGADLGKLAALLYPDVVLRAAGGAAHPQASAVLHGAAAVARRAAMFIRPVMQVRPSLVNGAAGAVLTYENRPVALLGFTIVAGRITEIDAITDPDRLSRLDLPVLDG